MMIALNSEYIKEILEYDSSTGQMGKQAPRTS